jgi:hypothetical protein
MQRIEINVQTGEERVIDLTAEEIAIAQAQKAKFEAEQAAVVQIPNIEELIARIVALEAK